MEIPQKAIDLELVKQLHSIGLSAKMVGERIETGLNGLVLHRGKCELVRAQAEVGIVFVASLELIAHINIPDRVTIADLITATGLTSEEAFATCVLYYCDVTFPALRGLCDPAFTPPGPPIKLATITQPENRSVNWRVFRGNTQVLRDTDGKVAAFLNKTPALTLVLDTLTGYLSYPRLHWCKLFAAMTPKSGLLVGCSIDGQRSAEAESELRSKITLKLDPTDRWELRHFIILQPDGQPQGNLAETLRIEADKQFQSKKPWWKFN
jgi:hypothetical protein